MENKEIGIYVHIPFCKRKCDYCDFISYSKNEEIQKIARDFNDVNTFLELERNNENEKA